MRKKIFLFFLISIQLGCFQNIASTVLIPNTENEEAPKFNKKIKKQRNSPMINLNITQSNLEKISASSSFPERSPTSILDFTEDLSFKNSTNIQNICAPDGIMTENSIICSGAASYSLFKL